MFGVSMTLGRILGWVLMFGAGLIASAEGIAAVATGAYDSVATGELWTLITGQHPHIGFSAHGTWSEAMGTMLMAWPAWTVIGAMGCLLILACRPRRKRYEYREASMRFSTTIH